MYLVVFFFFFFFSSRRRHTRFDCDWSSDVCSSDLAVPPARIHAAARRPGVGDRSGGRAWPGGQHRSEERRVGKEGRSRWSPYHLKKKKKKSGRENRDEKNMKL